MGASFAPLFAPPPPPRDDNEAVTVECSELDNVYLLDVAQTAIADGDDGEDLDTALDAEHAADGDRGATPPAAFY